MGRILLFFVCALALFVVVVSCSGKKKGSVDVGKVPVVGASEDSESQHIIPNNTWPGQVWPEPGYVSEYLSEHEIDDIDNAQIVMSVADHYYDEEIGDNRVGSAVLWEDGPFDVDEQGADYREYPETPKILFQEWLPDEMTWSKSTAVVEGNFVPLSYKSSAGGWHYPETAHEYRAHGPIAITYVAPTYDEYEINEEPFVNTRPIVVISFYGAQAFNQVVPQYGPVNPVLCVAIGHFNPDPEVENYEFKVFGVLAASAADWPSEQTYLLNISPEIGLTPDYDGETTRFSLATSVNNYQMASGPRIFCGQYEVAWDDQTGEVYLETWGDSAYSPTNSRFWPVTSNTFYLPAIIGDGIDVEHFSDEGDYMRGVAFHWIERDAINQDDRLDSLRVVLQQSNGSWDSPEIVAVNNEHEQWTGLYCEFERTADLLIERDDNVWETNLGITWIENTYFVGEGPYYPGYNIKPTDRKVSRVFFAFRWKQLDGDDPGAVVWAWNPEIGEPLELDVVENSPVFYPPLPPVLEYEVQFLHPTLSSRNKYVSTMETADFALFDINYWILNTRTNLMEMRSKVVNHRHDWQAPVGMGYERWYVECEDSGVVLYLTENRETARIASALSQIKLLDISSFDGTGRGAGRLHWESYWAIPAKDPEDLPMAFLYYRSNFSVSPYSKYGSHYLFESFGLNYLVRANKYGIVPRQKGSWYSWIVDSHNSQF